MSWIWIPLLAVLGLAGPDAATLREHPWPTWSEGRAEADVRPDRVRLPTGVEVDVAEVGPRDGAPVLLLHGFPDSWYSYTPVLERLPAGWRAIVPTQRGHGDSDRPACCYEIRDFAADAVALLDALGIERAAVVGHSMGSFVAQRLAIDYPERVSRLVLIGSGTTLRTEPVVAFDAEVRSMGDTIPPEFVRDFQASTAVEPLPAGFLAGIVAESGKVPAWVWRDTLAGILRSDAAGELHRVPVPTLVVWGDGDGLFGRGDQEALVRQLPAARLLVYAGSGHSPHWERPQRFCDDLEAFLGDTLRSAQDRAQGRDRPGARLPGGGRR